MSNKTNYIFEAKALAKIGISVIPVKLDGSKLPAIQWKVYQDRIMSSNEIERHFSNCGGVIAITGEISNLLCIDFDLDKQREYNDFWKDFMDQVPVDMKKRMLINQTRSGGYHIWLRTDYEDKSRKLTHRPLTIPELHIRYNTLIEKGANEETASLILLKKPVECIIETRSKGSYGVFAHEQYKRFYGKSLNFFSCEEINHLLDTAYSLDYCFKTKRVYSGDSKSYKIINQFNEDTTSSQVIEMLEQSGLFEFYHTESNGNHRLRRVGSSNPFSAVLFEDTSILHIFGLNPLVEEDKNTMTPFEIYCAVNNFNEQEAVEKIGDGKEVNVQNS